MGVNNGHDDEGSSLLHTVSNAGTLRTWGRHSGRATNGAVLPVWKIPCPGRIAISKSMLQDVEYGQEIQEAFDLEAEGSNAEGPRNRAEWASTIAAEIRKQGMARSKEVLQAKWRSRPTTS